MKKKIIFIIIILIISSLFLILLTNKSNQLKEITYKEINQKINNNDTFILIVSKSNCSHCAIYKPKVEKIAKENNLTIYFINYDKLNNKEEFLKQLNLDGSTPTTLFFKKGKETSILNRIVGDLSSNTIKNKFKEMGFIEK